MMEDEKKKLHKFITYISLTSDNERLNTAHTEKKSREHSLKSFGESGTDS